jgi:hypothetical protein
MAHEDGPSPEQDTERVIERLRQRGVLFDDLLLLKPDLEHATAIQEKISTSLQEVRKGIDRLRATGKRVLYMPGSYDMVHLGHAHHIQESIQRYLALPENRGLAEDDVAVVALADDDDLIRSAKGSKHVDQGGSEIFRRPVQSADEHDAESEIGNWRLYELASIPMVDRVGFLPSPLRATELATPEILAVQRHPNFIAQGLERLQEWTIVPPQDATALSQAVGQYRDLLELMRADPSAVAAAFESGQHPWSIQAWQLFIHAYLGAGDFEAPMVRMMSDQDADYALQVSFLMHATGIATSSIPEESLVTTSELLKRYGPAQLLDRKRRNYDPDRTGGNLDKSI